MGLPEAVSQVGQAASSSRRPFVPAVFGSDIGAYSLARSFHEQYGVITHVFGKFKAGPCLNSRIVDFTVDPDVETAEALEGHLFALAAQTDEPVIALGVGDGYVRLLSACKARAPQNVIIPYEDNAFLDRLMLKERFYALCDACGIAHPATLAYRLDGPCPPVPFGFPVVVKPSDSAAYFGHPFPDQHKVYFLDSEEQFVETVEAIRRSGYEGALIVQEYIPGDDDCMHLLTCYSGASGKVGAACLGHVLLEEHTPTGIGNSALVVSEENEGLIRQATRMLEGIGFRGFANIDIRYDARTGRYCFLDCNARQGRCNYYATVAGVSLVRYLVEDAVYHAELPPARCEPGHVWTVVPKGVARRYADLGCLEGVQGKWVNPLFYAEDPGLERRLRLFKNYLGHYRKFRRFYHPNRLGRP